MEGGLPRDIIPECTVCYECYDDDERKPMVLICGHSFCFYCCQKLSSCPTCRQIIQVFPKVNYEFQRLLANVSPFLAPDESHTAKPINKPGSDDTLYDYLEVKWAEGVKFMKFQLRRQPLWEAYLNIRSIFLGEAPGAVDILIYESLSLCFVAVAKTYFFFFLPLDIVFILIGLGKPIMLFTALSFAFTMIFSFLWTFLMTAYYISLALIFIVKFTVWYGGLLLGYSAYYATLMTAWASSYAIKGILGLCVGNFVYNKLHTVHHIKKVVVPRPQDTTMVVNTTSTLGPSLLSRSIPRKFL